MKIVKFCEMKFSENNLSRKRKWKSQEIKIRPKIVENYFLKKSLGTEREVLNHNLAKRKNRDKNCFLDKYDKKFYSLSIQRESRSTRHITSLKENNQKSSDYKKKEIINRTPSPKKSCIKPKKINDIPQRKRSGKSLTEKENSKKNTEIQNLIIQEHIKRDSDWKAISVKLELSSPKPLKIRKKTSQLKKLVNVRKSKSFFKENNILISGGKIKKKLSRSSSEKGNKIIKLKNLVKNSINKNGSPEPHRQNKKLKTVKKKSRVRKCLTEKRTIKKKVENLKIGFKENTPNSRRQNPKFILEKNSKKDLTSQLFIKKVKSKSLKRDDKIQVMKLLKNSEKISKLNSLKKRFKKNVKDSAKKIKESFLMIKSRQKNCSSRDEES